MSIINLSIIIPVYNEEKRLQITFTEVDNFIISESKNFGLEIIFVNDGSKDKTGAIIQNYLKDKNNIVKFLSYDINKGKGFAVRKGMLESTGDYVLMADADMSTSLFEIKKFVPFMERGAEVMIGTRKNNESVLIKKQPWYRQKMGEVYAFLARCVTGVKIKDFGCGFKVFSREAINNIFSKSFVDGWIFDTEILFLSKKFNYFINEVGVHWKNDEDTRVNAFRDIYRSLVDLLRIYFGHKDYKIKTFKTHIVIIISLAILFYLPYLLHPGFSLLDDPWYLNNAKSLSLFDWSGYISAHGNRLIPFTLFFYSLLYKIIGYSAFGFIVLRLIELIVILLLVYYLITILSNKKRALLGTAFVLLSSPTVTNFYEFETQDHISALLLLIITVIYFRFFKNIYLNNKINWLSIFSMVSCLFLFFLTKETNIFIVPLFAALVVYDIYIRNDRRIKLLNVSFLSLGLIWLIIFFLHSNKTTATFSEYGIHSILRSLIGYSKIFNFNILLVIFAIISFVLNFRLKEIKVIDYRKIFILLVAIFSFGIYIPWSAIADRYMMVPQLFFYILFFSQINLFKNRKLAASLLILVFASNLFFVSFHMVRFFGSRVADGQLFDYLSKNNKGYDQVCFSLSPQSIESIIEINIWLNKVNNFNKKVCTLTKMDEIYGRDVRSLFDNESIYYGDNVKLTSSTLVIIPDFSFVSVSPVDQKYSFSATKRLEYSILNIHPLRGLEMKKFGWIIGKIK